MATGTIATSTLLQFPGLSFRSTNCEMQLFVPLRSVEDVGYVWPYRQSLKVYLYNGSSASCDLTELIEEGFTGINTTSDSTPIEVPSGGVFTVSFEVTTHGPGVIDATCQFVSTGAYSPTLTIVGTRRFLKDGIPQPRPISMTDAMAEAYAYANPMDTIYDTLEFTSSETGGKVMVVHSDEKLVTPQGTFLPCRFSFELPETQSSVRGEMKITVDFLPREAQIWIREQTQSRGNVTVIWRQYLGEGVEPDAWYPIPLEVSNVEQTPLGATATALFPDLVNMPFPRRIMTTVELPGGIV